MSGVGESGDMESLASASCSSSSSLHTRTWSGFERKLDFSKHMRNNEDLNPSKITQLNGNPGAEHPHCRVDTPKLRTSLENDIEQLQMRLHQEKIVRMMLERALGRASSAISPGHKHIPTEAKDLISEIELLEEEVASREHHVLSLYRSIFDQCVSRSSSIKGSQTPSPSHTKPRARKKADVISNAFCSSRKFSLQSLQVLGSFKDPKKKFSSPKSTRATQSSERRDFPIASSMVQEHNSASLWNHLERCPNKLSEDLVRCMALIYHSSFVEANRDAEKPQMRLSSRSCTTAVLPRHKIGDEQDSSCRHIVQISCLSTIKKEISNTSVAMNNYRELVEQLECVDLSTLGTKAKLAFWINVFNSLVMNAHLTCGVPYTSLGRISLFHKATYNIGGHVISAGAIENIILSCHAPRFTSWFETVLCSTIKKKSEDEKQIQSSGLNLLVSDPRVYFTLCTGASSDPMFKVYTSKHIEEELEMAKKDFLQTNVVVKKSKKILLPKMLDRFAKECSITTDDLLVWVCDNVDRKLQELIQTCIGVNSKKKASQVIEWIPYNTKFQYTFEKNMT